MVSPPEEDGDIASMPKDSRQMEQRSGSPIVPVVVSTLLPIVRVREERDEHAHASYNLARSSGWLTLFPHSIALGFCASADRSFFPQRAPIARLSFFSGAFSQQ